MSGFYKNVMHLLKGNVFYHLVTIASLIFLAKLQSPKVLGEYALFFSSVTILGSLFTGRLELALVSLKEYSFYRIFVTGRMLSLGLCILFFLGYLFLIICGFLSFKIRYLLGVFATFFYAHSLLQMQLLNKTGAFNKVSRGKFILALLTAFSQILLSYYYKNSLVLCSGYLFALVFSSLYYYTFEYRNFKSLLYIPFGQFKKVLRACKDFVLINNTSSVINLCASQGVVIVMNYFFGATCVGFFSVAQKTLNAPASLLSRAFSDVFFKEVSSTKNKFNTNLEAFFIQNLKLLFLASLVILGVFFLVGKTVYVHLFGEDYIESYSMALYIIYFFLVRFIVTSMNSIVISKGLLKIDFKFNILLFVSQLLPLSIGGYLSYSIYVILPFMCVMGIMAYLYLFAHTYRLIKNNRSYE